MAADRPQRPGGWLPPGRWRRAPGFQSRPTGTKPVSRAEARRARFKLTIEYAGTRYSGWQIQLNARTVQGEIERALAEVAGAAPFELYASGRTDAGVHALAQVAHLDLATTLPAETLCRRLNDALPSDIVVLGVEPTSSRFHARHDAVARAYVYQVAGRRTAFAKAHVWWVKEVLDIGTMRTAAEQFVGFHDFHAFTDDDRATKSTQVKLDRLDLIEDGDLLVFHVEGSHFLWKMVRRLVGVLVEVGRGGLSPHDVAALLSPGSSSEAPARLTAPASGLFLARVYYPGDGREPIRGVTTVSRPLRLPRSAPDPEGRTRPVR